MRRSCATAIALLFALAGCGSNAEPAAPVAAPTTPAAVATTDAVDQYGERACLLVAEAIEGNTLMKDGVVAAIAADGAKSTHPSVVSAAGVLPEKYGMAVAAQGEDEAITELDLTSAAQEMLTACVKGNLN